MKIFIFILAALLTPVAIAVPAQASHCGMTQDPTEIHTSGCQALVMHYVGVVTSCIGRLAECTPVWGPVEIVIDLVNVVLCIVDPDGRACS